jgi:hypothetical protein
MRHYRIFGSTNDYFLASYRDITEVEGAVYQPEFLPGCPTLVKKLHTAHCLVPFAVKNKLPLRKLWYKKYFSGKYRAGDEYVFVFFYPWHTICQNGYLDYLRKNYPGCKCVLFLCDIDCARRLNIEEEKKRFDHVMVFERFFARAHGIEYYPLVYSDYRNEVSSEKKDIDLLFVGWAKGRYKLLRQIYDRLTTNGVNCQFYLTKLDEEVPVDCGIHTRDWVPYAEYIELVKRAKCILDIVPPNTDCSTLRVNEALSYKCKILTNNERIVFEEFYDPESISAYPSPDEIDIDFVRRPYNSPDYNGYIKGMTPGALIRHLNKVLFDNGGTNHE